MAISRFQSRFKTRTDLMDNITPNNVVQMNASVPAGEWKPANWLPVVWQNEKSKDYFTISSGKVVSFDASGRIVPSGLLRACLEATHKDNTKILTYTSDDVKARVIDIMTGEFVAAPKTVSIKEFITAASQYGWIHTDLTNDNLAAYQAGAKDFISAPVGVAAYDVYVWAGDDPANLHFTNYQKQHLIQFFSDVQMRVAHVCDTAVSTYDVTNAHLQTGANMADSTHEDYKPNLAGIDLTNVVAFDLGDGKVCPNTSETPVTFVNWPGNRERSDISLLAKAGDWYLDADAGVMYFYETGGNAAPVDSSDPAVALNEANNCDIKYFDYSAAASTQDKMMHLVGDAVAGDFVTFDAKSNFKVLAPLVVADSALGANTVAALKTELDRIGTALEDRHYEESLVVGRVYEMIKEPRGLLERVKTGFSGSEFGADAQMPGSATKGFSDLITLSDETIANEIAIINVKIQ
jgi:hypothetical protein